MDSESNPVSRLALDIPRAQRREDALKSLGMAPVIDLTDDDNPPWEHLEVRPHRMTVSICKALQAYLVPHPKIVTVTGAGESMSFLQEGTGQGIFETTTESTTSRNPKTEVSIVVLLHGFLRDLRCPQMSRHLWLG